MFDDLSSGLDPTPLELANAVEIIGNILYLIEQDMDDPVAIKAYISVSEPAMTTLRIAALTAQRREKSGESPSQ